MNSSQVSHKCIGVGETERKRGCSGTSRENKTGVREIDMNVRIDNTRFMMKPEGVKVLFLLVLNDNFVGIAASLCI